MCVIALGFCLGLLIAGKKEIKLQVVTFQISIRLDRRQYIYTVEKLEPDHSFDYYRVIARNGAMVLKNNQPVLTRHNLKHRRPKWEVESNPIWNKEMLKLICEAIELQIKK